MHGGLQANTFFEKTSGLADLNNILGASIDYYSPNLRSSIGASYSLYSSEISTLRGNMNSTPYSLENFAIHYNKRVQFREWLFLPSISIGGQKLTIGDGSLSTFNGSLGLGFVNRGFFGTYTFQRTNKNKSFIETHAKPYVQNAMIGYSKKFGDWVVAPNMQLRHDAFYSNTSLYYALNATYKFIHGAIALNQSLESINGLQVLMGATILKRLRLSYSTYLSVNNVINNYYHTLAFSYQFLPTRSAEHQVLPSLGYL